MKPTMKPTKKLVNFDLDMNLFLKEDQNIRSTLYRFENINFQQATQQGQEDYNYL